MQLIDTHCHLNFDPLAKNVSRVIARANQRDVSHIVVPAYDLESWQSIEELTKINGVFAALGLHPWTADEPIDLAKLEDRLTSCGAVAVGEIGLDSIVDKVPMERQLEVLESQLEIAVNLDLPVLLHCRGAFEEMLALLARFSPQLKGVIHAFSKGPKLMQRFVNLGLHIAFGGAITRLGAKRARCSAAEAPTHRLLLETDAPSIGLDGVEPLDVEPRHIFDIANALAKLRNESAEQIAMVTTNNAKQLFKIH
jgi:TatD family hydrolase